MAAKKSNKTAHVLGLITNGKQEISENTSVNEKTISQTQKTSVEIKRPDDTSHISEVIKQKLIEEFEPKKQTQTTSVLAQEKPETNTNISTQPEQNSISPDLSLSDSQQQTIPSEADSEISKPEVSKKQNVTKEEFEAVLRNNDNEIIFDSENYIYINVMETFVKEVIVDYMKQYGSCTCNRCIIDTMALALTNLPSKYIVAEKGGLYPLMNVYRTKYAAQISTEVLKDCLTVGKFPHHDR